MWDLRKTKYLLNLIHISKVINEVPVVLVPIIFEKNENE